MRRTVFWALAWPRGMTRAPPGEDYAWTRTWLAAFTVVRAGPEEVGPPTIVELADAVQLGLGAVPVEEPEPHAAATRVSTSRTSRFVI
jgi:hypothetical protein